MEHQYREQVGCRRQIIVLVSIMFGIFACVSVTVVGLDMACYRDVATWLPVYPNAEVVSSNYTMFRPWAMGRTQMILHSEDDFVTVNGWYIDQMRAITDRNTDRGIATTNYRVQRDPDSDGTLISLSSSCAN